MTEPITTIAITAKVVTATLFAVGAVFGVLSAYYANAAHRSRRKEEELEEIKQNRCRCQCQGTHCPPTASS